MASFAKILTDSQPAIVLAAAVAFVSCQDRWQVAAALLLALELAALLLARRRLRSRQRGANARLIVRFVGRTVEARQPVATQVSHRRHLQLVP
jgi:membrane protein implicated in regulation of membrane protease activity